MSTYQCNKCGITLTKDNWFKSCKTNNTYQCKNCYRIYKYGYYKKHEKHIQNYQKKYHQRNGNALRKKAKQYHKQHYDEQQYLRQQIMHNLKINGCAICGYDKCDAALVFHHVNQEDKKMDVAQRILQRKNNIIVKELNKCILLCCICHREIHEKERSDD